MTDKPETALGATLVADLDAATVPRHPQPQAPFAVGSAEDHDQTLPAALANASGSAVDHSPSIVSRAGRPTDYTALLPVDPAHYVRERELARGGMGRIMVARDRRLGREVAIKELYAPTDELRLRFEREARITARLNHPSTVGLLEAGVWPTGEPFYAMTLIAGRALDKVIAAAGSAAARFGLVANVLAVADTIAYAHDRKIVHRDLKPANVLVGEYGETVVIDWGLAKDLREQSLDGAPIRPSAPDVGTSPSTSGGAATEHGAVIGTPAYMPPEQAEGEAVDERADVYALGALLYHVLAGVAPYVGHTAAVVLAEVITGPPRRLAELVPEAPPDLITIVEKAMARNPADRYPTAKELAAELKTFQTGQLVRSHHYRPGELLRRWMRKHRTALGVAAVAVVVLIAVALFSVQRIVKARELAEHERAIAEQQRAIAVQRDADAQELTSFMLGDLHDKLTAIGKLDLLETVAHKAVGYYDHRRDGESDQDGAKRATALISIGDVLVSKGEFVAGRAEYDKAGTIQAQRLAVKPTNLDAMLGMANVHDRLAQVSLSQGDPKSVETHEREAIRGLEVLLARDPDRVDAGLVLLNARRALGDTLVELGDGTAAAKEYRAAIELAKAHLAKTPGMPKWQRGLAINHSQLGALLLLQGDAEGALREEREDIALSAQLVATRPADTQAQNDLAGAHLRLGDLLHAKGDDVPALAEFRASLAVMKHLTTLDPTNGDWQHDRASCHDRIGNLLLAKHDSAGARAEYEAARDLRAASIKRDPTSVESRNLAVSHNKLGNVFETDGKFAPALAEYELGNTMFTQLTKADPKNAGLQRDLAVSDYLIADMLLALGKREQALARHRASLAISVLLAAQDPTNAVWQSDVIEGHGAVAKVLLALHERADALAEYRAALSLAEAQATKDTANPAWTGYATQMRAAITACCAKLK